MNFDDELLDCDLNDAIDETSGLLAFLYIHQFKYKHYYIW